ncbi:hypothetical protein F2P81_020678 [Scophthalmus maximus]|uniref:Uncharacterized protein n=1 Tax=Scophthalmus maximus TaxID=52904 RepID=A0A6A4S4G1_SCOMX|nr:hypothetical protein F2P81_020678 [Scophthalmus maximus]
MIPDHRRTDGASSPQKRRDYDELVSNSTSQQEAADAAHVVTSGRDVTPKMSRDSSQTRTRHKHNEHDGAVSLSDGVTVLAILRCSVTSVGFFPGLIVSLVPVGGIHRHFTNDSVSHVTELTRIVHDIEVQSSRKKLTTASLICDIISDTGLLILN